MFGIGELSIAQYIFHIYLIKSNRIMMVFIVKASLKIPVHQ